MWAAILGVLVVAGIGFYLARRLTLLTKELESAYEYQRMEKKILLAMQNAMARDEEIAKVLRRVDHATSLDDLTRLYNEVVAAVPDRGARGVEKTGV